MSFNVFSINPENFFSLEREMKGVKKITERVRWSNWRAVSEFDREGFLVRRTNYESREAYSIIEYEYSVSDTLLVIKRREPLRRNNNRLEDFVVYKFHYNYLGQCQRFEIFFSQICLVEPVTFGDSFVYEDGLLVSYEVFHYQRSFDTTQLAVKVVFTYNDNRQPILRKEVRSETDITFSTYKYNQQGQLTDYIRVINSDEGRVFSDIPTWSRIATNKVHIRYARFDKNGNWQRNDFMTERSNIPWLRRSFEYW